MKTLPIFRGKKQAGYALLMVLVMLGVAVLILGATMGRTSTNAKLNERNNALVAAQFAAEAATDKVMARMMSDFQRGAEGRVLANLSSYRTMVPTSAENSYWSGFSFSDGNGTANSTYVERTTATTNPVFTALAESYQGLSGFASNYRIVSNVKPTTGLFTNLTGTVGQDVQVAEIPIFQFAIFYNGLLEFTWAAPLTVRGRTHSNSNIYVGSAWDLTFNQTVSAAGIITNPPWDGKGIGQYTGAINYNGQPPPGYAVGYNTLTLPIGTTNTPDAIREIVNLPTSTNEDVNSDIGQQRYFNKAGMVIAVSNAGVTITFKSSAGDPAPFIYQSGTTNWTINGFTNFLSTTNTLGDQREGQSMKLTQIDIGALRTWMSGNSNVSAKFSAGSPLNILYVTDSRSTNSTTGTAVRLINGATLPTNGLTVATPNPLYIQGNYNCPDSTLLGTTNTSKSVPSSVVADALTLLSANWSDASSLTNGMAYSSRPTPSVDMTVNTAIISGMVYSTDSQDTTFSGGVVNQPRLLQNWSSRTLTLNTSIVNLFDSVRASHQWQSPGIYYNAPTRNFNFDTSFTQPTRLPPGTPCVRRLIRSIFCNPPPNNISYASTNALDYVPF